MAGDRQRIRDLEHRALRLQGTQDAWYEASGPSVVRKLSGVSSGLSGFSTGAIPIGDGTGSLTEDPASLFYDKANKRFGIGTALPLSRFDVVGALGLNRTSVSIDTTVGITHCVVKVDAAAASRTITLPTAQGIDRRVYVVKNITASSGFLVTVATTGGQTIDGATTYALNERNAVLAVQSDGANWEILWRD